MPQKSLLNKYHIDQIHAAGFLGQNITVAILDTGIYPHQDLIPVYYFKDFIHQNPVCYDDSGHGTHVAGIIASSKLGIAPKCNLIVLKVLNHKGEGKTSQVLNSFQWLLNNQKKYNIRIINISIGSTPNQKQANHRLIQGVTKLWNSGMIVVSAAGNQGPKHQSITSPGISPHTITVGACDDYLSSPNRLFYSGVGPTSSCICKPDVIAPGSNIISCSPTPSGYIAKSGTSMATPFVSGVLALLLSKEPSLTPKDVKLRLYETSKDVGFPKSKQGWGVISPADLLNIKIR